MTYKDQEHQCTHLRPNTGTAPRAISPSGVKQTMPLPDILQPYDNIALIPAYLHNDPRIIVVAKQPCTGLKPCFFTSRTRIGYWYVNVCMLITFSLRKPGYNVNLHACTNCTSRNMENFTGKHMPVALLHQTSSWQTKKKFMER